MPIDQPEKNNKPAIGQEKSEKTEEKAFEKPELPQNIEDFKTQVVEDAQKETGLLVSEGEKIASDISARLGEEIGPETTAGLQNIKIEAQQTLSGLKESLAGGDETSLMGASREETTLSTPGEEETGLGSPLPDTETIISTQPKEEKEALGRERSETALKSEWKGQLEKLQNEYAARRSNMPLKETPLSNIINLIYSSPDKPQQIYYGIIKKIKEDNDFEDIRKLGFEIGTSKIDLEKLDLNANLGTLLSSPFPTLRQYAPKDYKGPEAGSFGDGRVKVWKDRVQSSSFDTVVKELLSGYMTQEDQVIMHETTHGFQSIKDSESHKKAYQENSAYKALAEAQAFLSQDFLSPRPTSDEGQKVNSEYFQKGYGVTEQEANYAINVTKDLRALGLNMKEVAEFINPADAQWDEQKGTCPELDKKIGILKQEKGIPSDADLSLLWQIHVQKRKNIGQKLNLFVRGELEAIYKKSKQ